MDVKAYLAIVWRRRWVIILTVVMTTVVTGMGTVLMITPQYVASTTLRIALSTNLTGEAVRGVDLAYADRLANTYNRIATSRPVLQELAQKLGHNRLPSISVTFLPNTELMRISAEDSDPALAAQAANAMTEILITHGKELYSGGGKKAQEILGEQLAQMQKDISQARSDYESLVVQSPNDSQRIAGARRLLELREGTYARLLEQYERARANQAVREDIISVIEPAVVPTRPSSPDLLLNTGVGFLVGLICGFGLAFLFENLDATLYTAEKIQKVTRLPILGQIPRAKRQQESPFFIGNSPQEDAFRRLRITIFALADTMPLRTLLVTSAEHGEGKSTIVANLAFVIAQTGRRVMVVDADMRRPTLHKIFGMPNAVGLSSVLKQKVRLAEAVQKTDIPGIYLLTSGLLASNSAELLGSPLMENILKQLAADFDMVVLDSPALLAAADAAVLAPAADGVIQVVGHAQSQEDGVRNVGQQLILLKAKLIGVVVNRANVSDLYYYYYPTEPPPTQRLLN